MKRVRYSTAAKKDLKRYRNDEKKMRRFYEVLELLKRDLPLPERCRAHKLLGEYEGFWECHMGNDFLLIWVDEEADIIQVVRLGTHSELF